MNPSIWFIGKCAIDGSKMLNFAPNLYECPNCSLISADFPVKENLYDATYLAEYQRRAESPLSDLIMRRRWTLVLKHQNGYKSLLDYGAATGAFLDHSMRPENLAVGGYDINPAAKKYLQYPKGIYPPDILTMFDVLEHLTAPLDLFRFVSPKLLVVTVPNVNFVVNSELPNWRHFKPGEHLHYFSNASLAALFERAGYKVVETSYAEGSVRNPDRPGDILTMVGRRAA